ncbi:MAG TPA: ABC transporter substrate-binding protein, partial [Candidatus Hodarchaeales archaeon]|nr:ABC transporter substrate-binding protein [Candidatus Hodarchaeales archaeon]
FHISTFGNSRGVDANHGGFDVSIMRQNSSILPMMDQFATKDRENASNPRNYYHVNSSVVDIYSNSYAKQVTEQDRIDAISWLSKWFIDQVPASVVYQGAKVVGLSKNITNFNAMTPWGYAEWDTDLENVSLSLRSEVINCNPYYTITDYEKYCTEALYPGGLFKIISNASEPYRWQVKPYLVDWYNKTEDEKVWFFNLKNGLKWHDGEELNATDIKSTWDLRLTNNAVNFGNLSDDSEVFNNSSQIIVHNRTLVEFQVSSWYAGLEITEFSLQKILPSHVILPMVEQAISQNKEIRSTIITSTANQPEGNSGPIGYGPYKLVQKYPDGSVLLTKWSDYNATLFDEGAAMIDNVSLRYNSNVSLSTEELLTGVVAFVDGGGSISGIAVTLNLSQVAQAVVILEFAWEEIGYNQISSIWGMNPLSPRGELGYYGIESVYSDVNGLFLIFVFLPVIIVLGLALYLESLSNAILSYLSKIILLLVVIIALNVVGAYLSTIESSEAKSDNRSDTKETMKEAETPKAKSDDRWESDK